MRVLKFKDAEKARDYICDELKRQIGDFYREWAKEIGREAQKYTKGKNPSDALKKRQLETLKRQLEVQSREIGKEIEKSIKQSLYTVANEVIANNAKWLKELGFGTESAGMAFTSVPDAIVRRLITGQIYDNGWGLSKRIWGDSDRILSEIYGIMAKGLAENKSIFDIANEIAAYVNPDMQKGWNPLIAMRNTKTGLIEYKRIYRRKVDYCAQRLARTLAQHAYQQAFVAVTEHNPFVLKYRWNANGSRACPLCMERDGQLFDKDNLPLDHPNGMCVMEAVIDSGIKGRLKAWMIAPDGVYPEIDKFAKEFGYKG